MALIVDDREDVWANAQDNSKRQGEPPDNFLLIRPYHWKPFLGFADVNNAAGEDISGESTTTEDEDDVCTNVDSGYTRANALQLLYGRARK